MPDVVWLVPKSPLPAFDGARVAVCGLLSELSALGISIHLLVVNAEEQDEEPERIQQELGVSSVAYIATAGSALPLPSRMQSLLLTVSRPFLGITLQRYAAKSIRQATVQLLERTGSDTIVFDGLHPAAAFADSRGVIRPLEGVRFVYRAHNREAQIWDRKVDATDSGLKKYFFAVQARFVRRFEDNLVQAADWICPVSAEDAAQFKKVRSDVRCEVIPIGYDFSRPLARRPDRPRIFFIGRLDWPPNKEGLRWFLEKVWPVVQERRSELVLDIVGSGNGEWMNAYSGLRGVHFHGRVESIESFYDHAILCIIPVFFGSGTRVKAIESARFGRACISTAVGVEGLPLVPGESYVRAESADEWIQAIVDVDTEKMMAIGQQAHAALSQAFDRKQCARQMMEAVFPAAKSQCFSAVAAAEG